MANLTRAHQELFRRGPDECFSSLSALFEHCVRERENSTDRWCAPELLVPEPLGGRLVLALGHDGAFELNDWSFTQLCGHAGVSKETVNRLCAGTASQVLRETMPGGNKPLQLFSTDRQVRSIHGHSYTRLHNADLVHMLTEFAVDFGLPQKANARIGESGGGTGLYLGEQDMFCFLIDPTGWTEINGQAF